MVTLKKQSPTLKIVKKDENVSVIVKKTTLKINTPALQGISWPQWESWVAWLWRWEYDTLTAYNETDLVEYLWSSYICTAESTWNIPTDTDFWDLVASKWDQWVQGEQGIQWEQGIQGIQWPQGIQGIQGIQGETWPQGDPWINTWWSITGTLSNQTDLQTALNGKEDDGTAQGIMDTHESTYDHSLIATALQSESDTLQTVTDRWATTDNIITVPWVQFDVNATPATSAPWLLQWNATDETLDLWMPDSITLQIGQENQLKARNSTGSTISNWKPVYESGMLGNRPTIALARWNVTATSYLLGLTTQDIANNADGKVTTSGYVRNINTTGTPYGETWADGDTLWVSKATAGAITNIEPSAPHHCDRIGSVVNAHATQGSILVSIDRHQTLENLSDVNGTALTTSGQIPNWNNSTGYFDFDKNINDYQSTLISGTNIKTINSTSLLGSGDITISGGWSPAGSTSEIQFNTSGAFDADSNLKFDDANKRLSVQAGSSPQATIHGSATVGATINDVVTGSASLVTETLPSAPTGSVTTIQMPLAWSGGAASYANAWSGWFLPSANGTTYDFRVYPCLYAGPGVYYKSQNYEGISAGSDPNDGQSYDIGVTWWGVTITGETVYYFVEFSPDAWGNAYPLGVYNSTGETFITASGSNPTTPYPTFYTLTNTPPNAYTGGSATATSVGTGGISEYSTTIYLEVDSVANIWGTNYVSGSPTSGSFDDTGLGSYDAEIAWTDNGNATNSIARISVDGGSTWYYQFTGSNTSPYTFTTISNDSSAEARWGQTYSTIFTFTPHAIGLSPSNNTIYSVAGTDYSTTITTPNYFILKHNIGLGGKIIASSYWKTINGDFYDVGYTTWADGTTVTPTTYGFTGTAQNRDYRAYGFNSALGVYSATPLTLSTTSWGGTKSVSGAVTYPSGVTQIKILRQVNGGGYTVSKTFTSPTTSFTDDVTDTSWSGNTTVTPSISVWVAWRFDRNSTAIADKTILEAISTGTGLRYPKISLWVATDNSSDPTYLGHIYSSSGSGYMSAVTTRLNLENTLGGTPTTVLWNANVFNNGSSSSIHLQVKGQNDANLINTRSDFDTVAFGQGIATDNACTVQIQPARNTDVWLIYIGHSSMSDSSNIWSVRTSGGTSNADMTLWGWMRTSTGAVGTAAHSCRSDVNTGIYFPSADVMGLTAGWVEQARVDTGGTRIRWGTASSTYARVSGTLTANTTAVWNVGIGEDDLITYTVPANLLSVNSDRIEFSATGTFWANANNKRIRVYFGTSVLFDTTALAFNSGDWVVTGCIIRTWWAVQRSWVRFTSSNALLTSSTDYTQTGMNLASNQTFKLTGEGTANNDIQQQFLTINYLPI